MRIDWDETERLWKKGEGRENGEKKSGERREEKKEERESVIKPGNIKERS